MEIGRRYLNAGQVIGYAPELYRLMNISSISIGTDDQLYFTNVYLDENVRRELNIKLDSCSELFQSLPGPSMSDITSDIELRFEGLSRNIF